MLDPSVEANGQTGYLVMFAGYLVMFFVCVSKDHPPRHESGQPIRGSGREELIAGGADVLPLPRRHS
jgi:hypothetical protein